MGLRASFLLLAIDELWNDYAPFARMYMIIVSCECMRRVVPLILSIEQGEWRALRKDHPPSYEEMPIGF